MEDSSQETSQRGTRFLRMDPKGRIAIPSCHRTPWGIEAGSVLVLTQNIFEKALSIYTPDWWRTQVVPPLEQASGHFGAMVRHRIMGPSEDVTVDSQCRILISPALRKIAGISEEEKDRTVVLVGVGRSLELWAAELWEQHSMRVMDKMMHPDNREQMQQLNI